MKNKKETIRNVLKKEIEVEKIDITLEKYTNSPEYIASLFPKEQNLVCEVCGKKEYNHNDQDTPYNWYVRAEFKYILTSDGIKFPITTKEHWTCCKTHARKLGPLLEDTIKKYLKKEKAKKFIDKNKGV